jgi:thymidylate synthase ThyX
MQQTTLSVQAVYDPSKNLAGLIDTKSGIRVWTLLQQPGAKRPAVSAYLGARYSRSADSIPDIITETEAVDAPARLEKIFHNYGHASVAGMAHLFVMVENIPMATAMRFFNLCPCQDGQERSSRYQDFSKGYTFFRNYPIELSHGLRYKFEEILNSQVRFYAGINETVQRDLSIFFNINNENPAHKKTLESRAFDVTRQALPIGLCTSFCANMSAREWSRYISLMRGSTQRVEKIVGELLFQLLAGTDDLFNIGYTPEADGLIRHAEREPLVEGVIKLMANLAGMNISAGNKVTRLTADYVQGSLTLARHTAMLEYPFRRPEYSQLKTLSEQFGFVFELYNRHRLLGPIAQAGLINVRGAIDIGSLKDINRHRSLKRWIPVLDNNYNLGVDLQDPGWHLAAYLKDPFFSELKDLFDQHFANTYQKIMRWADEASNYLNRSEVWEWVRYMLPHAHEAEYSIYGSYDEYVYTIDTRVRPGGHCLYRSLVYEWAKDLARLDPFFKGLLSSIEPVNVFDRGQFLDRT